MNDRIGYVLSSEEHSPGDLVRNARMAEEAGFAAALISDHFHPWTDTQGHSPFVWSVLGAIAAETSSIKVGTGVTAPIIRTHPAIIAHAAATAAALMPGRFFLGLGAGENLNEHIVGQRWPAPGERLEMLEEAIEVIRTLWEGGVQDHAGKHYRLEDARIYDLPEELPPIMMAAGGPVATKMAARISDGLIATRPDGEQVSKFKEASGGSKPAYGKITVAWAESDEAAQELAVTQWPNAAMGDYSLDIRTPEDFGDIAKLVRAEDMEGEVLCSIDPAQYHEAVRQYFDAGFDLVFVHQVGPDQEGFIRFFEREVMPRFDRVPQTAVR